jgi:hypothetical protein
MGEGAHWGPSLMGVLVASERKVAANRANAMKSTGPRSSEGKAASRMNAMRHGLLAGTVPLLPWEDPKERARFDEAVEQFYQPGSIMEEGLVRQIGSLLWRLRRVEPAETAILANRMLDEVEDWQAADEAGGVGDPAAGGDDDVRLHPLLSYGRALEADAAHGAPLARLSRYETTVTNLLLKLQAELDVMQGMRMEPAE